MLAIKETGGKLRPINKCFLGTVVNNNGMLIRIILHVIRQCFNLYSIIEEKNGNHQVLK